MDTLRADRHAPVLFGTRAELTPLPQVRFMSPEALLAHCRLQLEHLDGAIDRIMVSQEKAIRDSERLQKVEAVLVKYQYLLDEKRDGKVNEDVNWENRNKLCEELRAIAEHAPPDWPYRGQVAEFVGRVERGSNTSVAPGSPEFENSFFMKADALAALKADVSSLLSSASAHQHIDMITMQNLMSQRQSAISLTTSMLQSLHEGAKGILANVGR